MVDEDLTNDDWTIVYPRITDSLLQGGHGKTLFADWMSGTWSIYPDAYKRAADMLVDAVEGHAPDDILILPIVFLYRHLINR